MGERSLPAGGIGAVFEIVEKPETIFAGNIIYAKDFLDISGFNSAIESIMTDDFWCSEKSRACTDKFTAQLMAKEQCEIWELFAYIRNYFMPNHGFKMAENGAQELEVFDTSEHKSGYAYLTVMRL